MESRQGRYVAGRALNPQGVLDCESDESVFLVVNSWILKIPQVEFLKGGNQTSGKELGDWVTRESTKKPTLDLREPSYHHCGQTNCERMEDIQPQGIYVHSMCESQAQKVQLVPRVEHGPAQLSTLKNRENTDELHTWPDADRLGQTGINGIT